MSWFQSGPLLHVGCGRERIDGWINIDVQRLPSVDVVIDATRDLRYRNARALYSEHFLEHLRLDQAIQFLLNAHIALETGRWMRLSTPNLDWVLATHYYAGADTSGKINNVLMLNKGFRGWGHQFLWNGSLLESALDATGFEEVRLCSYGSSALKLFDEIERHETSTDVGGLPHVLIYEARKGRQDLGCLAQFRDLVWDNYLQYLDPVIPRPDFGGLLPP